MSILSDLNPVQREAAEIIDGPLLILAGAGSGKTRVLVSRIAHMVERGVRPFNILAITFTNKAAREMKERVEKLFAGGRECWISTFHSLCVRILRRDIAQIGFDSKFTIYDADDQTRVMKQVLKEHNMDEKQFPAQMVVSVINRKKDSLITPAAYMEEAGSDYRESRMAGLYEAYQRKLRGMSALDFGDLIFMTAELFNKRPDILARYQHRFKYISVDEYQDTNYAQYQLVKMLSAAHNNICVVGDDDQSIYGWRGADIGNILGFERDFPGAKVIRLEQNYRSTKTILSAANEVIKNNETRKGKTLWTENADGALITHYRARSDDEEARFVVSLIKDRVNKGARHRDFSVLYRMNAQSRRFEDILVREGVPYRIVGGVRFYERREVKDVLAYLKAINNPLDDISLLRILNVPRRGIGGETEARLIAYAAENEVSLFDALESVGEIEGIPYNGKRVLAFLDLMREFSDFAAANSVSLVVKEVLTRVKYIEELYFIEKDKDMAKDREGNVLELLSKAEEFEKGESASLSAFLEEVALVADIDNYSEENDAVILMTVHSAKGLEFDIVALAGFEQNIFPTGRALYSPEKKDLEEERRLAYVAITRARKELFITTAQERRLFNNFSNNPPSQFLSEIPKDLIKVMSSEKPVSPGFAPVTAKPIKPYIPLPAPTKTGPPDYAAGDFILQKKYGKGKVLAIKPAGRDYEVTIEFDEVGQKKFMAHLSNLEKI